MSSVKDKTENNDIEFLREVTEILSTETYPNNILHKLTRVFSEYLPVSKVNIYIWDNNITGLRNFESSWSQTQKKTVHHSLNNIYSDFALVKDNIFFFNEDMVSLKSLEDYFIKTEMLDETEGRAFLYFPLAFSDEKFGLIEYKLKESKKSQYATEVFIRLLQIVSRMISGTLLSLTLREQMEISLNFYAAMKDIAKIIESQYELSYIIPIIGEMIDRFISAHLIYIFIIDKNNKNRFELIWPKACNDKEVYNRLKEMIDNPDKEFILSDDRRIGVFPLKGDEGLMGAIAAFSNIDELSERDVDYLVQLSQQSSTTIQRANVYAEVLKYATLDALTGLNNRRQFEIRLSQEIATTKRKNTPLCAMMIDVDYFKKVNDTYGHNVGDFVLKTVAQLITNEIREYDIPCRYGGEEFFVILPQTTLEEASLVAQRLRKTIENYKINFEDNDTKQVKTLKVTISIGVSKYENDISAEDFSNNADKALYEAKRNGRNRVIVYKSEE
ncbi:sensor domain-containing diguanylate cyclase [bacterium]|nr:sensor domain-containing diguanylate cyclase [bacterium]